ncbi:MAG: sigma-70 family RNA polymerase sigma factor [Armatimonadetes bacterium]|nr:sigma-70 family RNA polymerase sigma factor [Armatimonadota bacterium]
MERDARSAPDSELAVRGLRGDLSAFDVLVERYRQRVVGLTTRMLGDPARGEELAQEAFLRAFTRLALYDPARPFHTWLFRIAANLCLNQLRDEKPPGAMVSLDDDERGRDLPSPSPSPAEVAETHALQRSVRTAIQSLPAHYRAAVVMRYVAGLDYSEIAEALQLPMGTVKTHLFRAKELLRERLRGLVEEG